MIEMWPYRPELAQTVFRDLDPWDRLEAEAFYGRKLHWCELWADWSAQAKGHIFSVVFMARRPLGMTPFAVAGIGPSGAGGVALAGLLTADSAKWKRSIARGLLHYAQVVPEICRLNGIRRLEVRSWDGHPHADALLGQIGFVRECRMGGYGSSGQEEFGLFSLIIEKENGKGA